MFVHSKGFAQYDTNDSCIFFGNRPVFPYYHPSQPTCSKDFYTIKKDFINAFDTISNFDGIITISFFINYKGETNYYNSTFLDLNYQTLNAPELLNLLAKKLIIVIKKLGVWKPVIYNNTTINSRKFYSFRFTKGKISEILPK